MLQHWAIVLLAACAWSCRAIKVTVFLDDVLEASEHVRHSTVGMIHHFWWVGALTTVVGATLTIVGLMLQKSSHRQAAKGGKSAPQPYWMSWRWLLGLAVWLVGQVICWTADGLANRSLLACFNCWNIVVVFVVAPWYLGEAVVPTACVGAAVTFGGCIWVVLTGPRAYHLQTVETLQDSWTSLPFVSVLVCSLLAAAGLATRARSAAAGGPVTTLPVHMAVLSAIFAWYAVLLSKCASTLTVTSVEAKSQLGHWQYWAYLAAMGAFAVCQVHTLNMAMKAGTAMVVLPAYESLSMLGQVVICGAFFHEFRDFMLDDFVHFSCAIACVLCGITVMTSAAASSQDARVSETVPAC